MEASPDDAVPYLTNHEMTVLLERLNEPRFRRVVSDLLRTHVPFPAIYVADWVGNRNAEVADEDLFGNAVSFDETCRRPKTPGVPLHWTPDQMFNMVDADRVEISYAHRLTLEVYNGSNSRPAYLNSLARLYGFRVADVQIYRYGHQGNVPIELIDPYLDELRESIYAYSRVDLDHTVLYEINLSHLEAEPTGRRPTWMRWL